MKFSELKVGDWFSLVSNEFTGIYEKIPDINDLDGEDGCELQVWNCRETHTNEYAYVGLDSEVDLGDFK